MTLSVVEQILDLARWAPSGDNTQPWRFEIVDERHVVVHGFDTREHCVYDLDGRPSQISIGALLENISLAAPAHGLRAAITRRTDIDETKPTFDVHFEPATRQPEALAGAIATRSVQRRPMRLRALATAERRALEASVAPHHRVRWFEGPRMKWRVTRLTFGYAGIRLRMPEAYRVHRDIIAWSTRYSEDKVPARALGVDALTLRLMRFVLGSWERTRFFNTWLAGTWAPRLQMELVPGMACAAHFAICSARVPETIDDYVSAGRAVQRFWLTLTDLGLVMQPEMAPLIFARYVRNGVRFTEDERLLASAAPLARRAATLLGSGDDLRAVFMGRLGAGPAASARSLRLPLSRLMLGAGEPQR